MPTTLGLEEALPPILEKGALTAGEFRTPDNFVIPFQITVPEGWTVESINPFQLRLLRANNRSVYVSRVTGTVEFFLGVYEDAGSVITDPTSTEIAGLEATHVQVTTESQSLYLLNGQWTHDWYFVEVEGKVLLIAVEAANGVFDEFATEAAPVIESIEWVSAD